MQNPTENRYSLSSREKSFLNILEKIPVGILSFDAVGRINYANENFLRFGILYHFEIFPAVGLNIFENRIFPENSVEEELQKLREGISFEKEIKNVKTQKSFISVIVKGTPVFEEGRFAGGVLAVEDVKVVDEIHSGEIIKAGEIGKIIDGDKDLFFITDKQGKIKFYSGDKLNKFITGQGLQNLHISRLFYHELSEEIIKIIDDIVKEKTAGKKIFRARIGENETVFECRIEPVMDRQGEVNLIYFSFRDITELKSQEDEIKKLKLYEAITDTVADSIIILNSRGEIKYKNASTEFLTGYPPDELCSQFISSLLNDIDLIYFQKIKIDLAQYKVVKKELPLTKKSGETILCEVIFFLPGDEDDSICLCFSNLNNTRNMKAELPDYAGKYKKIIEEPGLAVCRINREGKILSANQAFIKILNMTEPEVIDTDFTGYICQEFPGETGLDLKNIALKRHQAFQLLLKTKGGERAELAAEFSAELDEFNEVEGFNIYMIQSCAATGIKELNGFKKLFENANEGMAIETGRIILTANRIFAKIFGYKNENELSEKNILDLVSPADTFKVAEYLELQEQYKDAPGRFEFLGKKRDGSGFYAELSVSSFDNEGKTYLVLIARDITERKRTQQAIRESEEKYRTLTESIDDFLYTFERGKSLYKPGFYTSSVEKVTGYTQSDFLKDSRLYLKIIHPDDLKFATNKMKELVMSKTHDSAEFEFRIINRQGNVVWVRNKAKLLRDDQREVQKVFGLVSDITLRKKTEEQLKKSTENLIKLNETKDQFISIISHDLRTPFSSILGFTELLLNDETLNETEKKQYVRFIRESSGSMLSLVNSLLDWTRLQTGRIRFEPERVNAKQIVLKSKNALEGSAYQKNITVENNVGEDFYIFVDENLITQVFNNLISNAVKFTKPGGSIVISCGQSENSKFYEFSVRDDGIGIRPDDQKKLFGVDTKFTTEGTAGEKGTGLGLSLVKEIIEKHNGTIWVISEYGQGSDFRFTLPIGSENILLVDSKNTDRILFSKILKHITPDYNVKTASNGREALEIIQKSTPALVVTNHLMPVMNGYEFMVALNRADIKGKPPVIILSEDVDRQAVEEYNELGVTYVFRKPVNLSEFKIAVAKSLRQGLKNL